MGSPTTRTEGEVMLDFLLGLASGIVVFAMFYGGLHDAPLTECEQEHNVYKCEWVTKPITTED